MATKRHERVIVPFPPNGTLILDIYWVVPGGTTVEAIFTINGVDRRTVTYTINSNQPPVCILGHHNPPLRSQFNVQADDGRDTYVSPRHYFSCRVHTVITDVNNGSAQAQATAVLD